MKHAGIQNYVIFICFLVIGYSMSSKFYLSGGNRLASSKFSSMASTSSIPAMNNGQRSILLIGVNNISPDKSSLVSLWLLTYLPSDPTLRLLPIYPDGKADLSDFEIRLSRTFSLAVKNNSLVPGEGFFKVLKENNYWWSGYIAMDQAAMYDIINLIGSTSATDEAISQEQNILDLPPVNGDKHKAFSAQVAVVQTACHQLSSQGNHPDWSKIIPLIPTHLVTDMDIQLLLNDWKGLTTPEQQFSCSFPTLALSSISQ